MGAGAASSTQAWVRAPQLCQIAQVFSKLMVEKCISLETRRRRHVHADWTRVCRSPTVMLLPRAGGRPCPLGYALSSGMRHARGPRSVTTHNLS